MVDTSNKKRLLIEAKSSGVCNLNGSGKKACSVSIEYMAILSELLTTEKNASLITSVFDRSLYVSRPLTIDAIIFFIKF